MQRGPLDTLPQRRCRRHAVLYIEDGLLLPTAWTLAHTQSIPEAA